MKNKVTNLKEGEKFLNYSDIIKWLLNMPPKGNGGYTIQDMKSRIEIIDSLEEQKDSAEINLKSEQIVYVKTLLKDAVFPIVHKDIVEFSDEFSKL